MSINLVLLGCYYIVLNGRKSRKQEFSFFFKQSKSSRKLLIEHKYLQRQHGTKTFQTDVILLEMFSIWGSGPPPPPFGGPPNYIKREKTSRMCAQKCRVLVLNSYADPLPPLSEILYLPLNVMGHYLTGSPLKLYFQIPCSSLISCPTVNLLCANLCDL